MTWVFAGLGGAWRREPAAVLAAVFLVAALALPLAQTSEGDAQGWFSQPELPLIWLACFLTAASQGFLAQRGPLPGLLLTMAAVVGAFAPLRAIAVHRAEGDLLGFQAPGLWLFVVALGFLLWRALSLPIGTAHA